MIAVDKILIRKHACRQCEIQCFALRDKLIRNLHGDHRRIVYIDHVEMERTGYTQAACIRRGQHNTETAHIRITRCARKDLTDRVETEPAWQRWTIRKRYGIGQHVASIDVCESADRDGEAERRSLLSGLISDRIRHYRCIVHADDACCNCRSGCCARTVGNGVVESILHRLPGSQRLITATHIQNQIARCIPRNGVALNRDGVKTNHTQGIAGIGIGIVGQQRSDRNAGLSAIFAYADRVRVGDRWCIQQ